MKNRLKLVAGLTAVILLSSGTYRHDKPIENYLALAKQPQFDCVGEVLRLENGNYGSAGSCVLIDSLHILSAAHCFEGADYKDTVVRIGGQDLRTKVATRKYARSVTEFAFLVNNRVLMARRLVLHPLFLQNSSCDIALIELDKPLRNVKPLMLNNEFNEKGDTATGVGYGMSGPANRPDLTAHYRVKLAGQNIIDSLGGALQNNQRTMLYADFDAPDVRENCNRSGDTKPLELEYSIGSGDSGGPLFRTRNNKLQLIGIACYVQQDVKNILKNGYYCQLMGWTRVSAFSDWIRKECSIK